MAKVLGLEKLEAKLRLTLKDKVTKGSVLEDVGKFVLNRIYQSTKKGVSQVTETKLKALSTGYKRYRKRFQDYHSTGEFFSSSRSNLTLTGQLLNALTTKIIRSQSQAVVLVENTQRHPTPQIPNKNGKLRNVKQESLTNKEVAQRVADNGRPFLGLDVTGRNRVRLMIVREIRKGLRNSGL